MDVMLAYKTLLLVHFAATWAMLGVILIVQVVHYPLFAQVGSSTFAEYEALHTSRITWVVAPLMLIELAAAVGLAVVRPPEVPSVPIWAGLILLAIIWASTAFIQVPLHNKLISGFDSAAHSRLVATNWLRTGAWGVRGLIAMLLVWRYSNAAA
ncbi:MAG: hypothetical protein KJO98_11475 [Rhodothermia bacterium]|nr:hypothetical protein [Rhodothermia bacterium]